MASKPSLQQTGFWHPKYWPIWVGYGIARLLVLLPFSWLMLIGKGLGLLLYRVASKRRHIVEVNIRLAFKDLSATEQAAFVRQTFIDNGIGFIESFLAWWGCERALLKRVRYEGEAHVEQALSAEKGVLIVAAHYSALDLGGFYIGKRFTMDVIYRRHDNPLMEYLITQGRLRFSQNAIERREIRRVLKNLRANHCIWYAPDQDMGKNTSVFVPFFGQQAATITATSRLAGLNDSPVIICSYHRDPDNKGYTVKFNAPLEGFPSSDLVKDAQRINELLEDAIRQCPEQYLWLHKRYKTQPDGRNKLYQ